MMLPRRLLLLALAAAATAAAQPRRAVNRPAIEVSLGATLAPVMLAGGPSLLYNYDDYTPPGLGVRWGMAGGLRARVQGIDATNPGFALVGEARYAALWHSTQGLTPLAPSTSARFGLLTIDGGLEQSVGAGRARPFFGVTIDVNAIEPGSVTTSFTDSRGTHTTSGTLAGSVWQLRLGLTPRAGVRAVLTRDLAFEAIAGYQLVNLVNRADYTPGNNLVDGYGRETSLAHAWLELGLGYVIGR